MEENKMTAQQEFEDFLKLQEVEGYTLGDVTGTADGDMVKYTELKVKVAQEKAKIAAFQKAKEEAFDALAQQHDSERIALGQTWQVYEDNDYQIPE